MAHEQELILKFDTMVSEERERKEPTNLFEGWSDEEKVRYMRQLEFSLPQYSEAPNLEDKEVPVRIWSFLFFSFSAHFECLHASLLTFLS